MTILTHNGPRTLSNNHNHDRRAPEAASNSGAPSSADSSRASPIDMLINGGLGPLARVRDTIDLTLEQVSAWITEPANRRQISNLVTLLDAQTQLIICQHRLLAVARLAEVVSSQASPEVVRRACADLLKLRLIDPYKEDKRPERMPPATPISEDAILRTLEEIGRAEELEQCGDKPSMEA